MGLLKLSSGGHDVNSYEVSESSPDLTEQYLSKTKKIACCKFILVQDSVFHPCPKTTPPNWDFLVFLFDKYKFYSTNIPLRILGLIVLIAHHWQEKMLVSKAKQNLQCKHNLKKCTCVVKYLN